MLCTITPSAQQIAAALIPGHFVTLYPCRTRGGYWRCEATAPASGIRTDGAGRSVWEAIAQVACLIHGWQAWLTTGQPHADSLPF